MSLSNRFLHYSLVTPGSVPLHLTPGISDSDQLHHVPSMVHLIKWMFKCVNQRKMKEKKNPKTDKVKSFAYTFSSCH